MQLQSAMGMGISSIEWKLNTCISITTHNTHCMSVHNTQTYHLIPGHTCTHTHHYGTLALSHTRWVRGHLSLSNGLVGEEWSPSWWRGRSEDNRQAVRKKGILSIMSTHNTVGEGGVERRGNGKGRAIAMEGGHCTSEEETTHNLLQRNYIDL